MTGNDCLLMRAARENDIGEIRRQLKAGADPLARNSNQRTAMHMAAMRGYVEAIKILLRAGDPAILLAARDSHGDTPLHDVSMQGRIKACRLLLDAGANFRAENNEGLVPLATAVIYENPGCTRMLLEADLDRTTPKTCDKWGNTPLHWAARRGDLEMVSCLLEAGADPLVKNQRGESPISLAEAGGHLDCAGMMRASRIKAELISCI